MNELFKEFEFNKKTEYTINEINGNLLPKDYLNFMLEHNGGEGNVGNNSYMQILKLEELIDYNNDYDIFKLFPTCFAFGTDLGGNHFCYNFENKEYFAIDSINISLEDAYCEASSLYDFIVKWDKQDY